MGWILLSRENGSFCDALQKSKKCKVPPCTGTEAVRTIGGVEV